MVLRTKSLLWKVVLLALVLSAQGTHVFAQIAAQDGESGNASDQVNQGGNGANNQILGGNQSSTPDGNKNQQQSQGVSPLLVQPPSVTLPTPDLPLPPPLQETPGALPAPTGMPGAQPQPKPALAPLEFNPPTAESLNLPSSQPAGNPNFAPASVGMPSMKIDESFSGGIGSSSGPGALGSMFDWARKLRFEAALRSGYDDNINSTHTNALGSWFNNLNGGVNYRFGAPRFNVNANLSGGLTWYPGQTNNQSMQGTVGFGLGVEYRYSPRLVLMFNTSSSYQEQLNPSLAGTSQNQNGAYVYTANSLSAAYQCSDLFTTVSRIGFISNFYPNNTQTNGQGFNQPSFTQSFRWLVRPTTTAVVDYNTDYYGYSEQGTSSWGQSLDVGFDHVFNPKWFWNFRLGAEMRTSQNSVSGSSNYIGPYLDTSLSWALGKITSLNWTGHVGTQPSGQQNVSFSPAARTGLNYVQGITAKLKANIGIFYLIQSYKDSPTISPESLSVINGNDQLVQLTVERLSYINYYQESVQANAALSYELNRIFQIDGGYQYLASICSGGMVTQSQEYNRGISYLQIKGSF